MYGRIWDQIDGESYVSTVKLNVNVVRLEAVTP
jgi:hypothetical protein